MRRGSKRMIPVVGGLLAGLVTVALAVADHSPGPGWATVPSDHVTLPAGNVIPNASFESSTAGWSGSLTRVRLGPAAPHGSFVARVAATSGSGRSGLSLDDWPGPVRASTVGVEYTGRIELAAANQATVHRSAVLVVREHHGGRQVAAWSSAPVLLTAAFAQLTVTAAAVRSGDAVDLYAYVEQAGADDAIYADAASLTSRYPVPVTNSVDDPSFEHAGHWSVSHASLTHVRTADAPDGTEVALATWDGQGRYLTVDDWPGTPTTQAGATYAASALIGAGSSAAVGGTARLIVREHARDGSYVGEDDSVPVRLGAGFTAVTVGATARRAGDLLDVYVALDEPRPGAAVRLDAVSLAQTTSTLGELALDVDQSALLGDTNRYAYVVLQESQYPLIPAIRAANPATRILAYEQVGSVLAPDACPAAVQAHVPHTAYALDYCWLAVTHPDWLLRGADARPLTYANYPHNVLLDIGQPAVRAAWAAAVIPEVRADGFDGVYLDDVNTHPGHSRDGQVAGYTDEQYGAAMTGFVTEVGGAVHSAGLLSMANVAVDPWRSWQVADAVVMARSLDVVTKEFWSHYQPSCSTQYGTVFTQPGSYDPATGGIDPGLSLELDYARRVQATGARFAGIDYDQAGDSARMAYGRATFLLAWDGRPGSAYFNRPAAARDAQGSCAAVDPAEPAWTGDIGLPTGPVAATGAVWSRTFTGGIVLVNPSPTAAASVPLDGSYRDSDGRLLRGTVHLAAGTAFVLTFA